MPRYLRTGSYKERLEGGHCESSLSMAALAEGYGVTVKDAGAGSRLLGVKTWGSVPPKVTSWLSYYSSRLSQRMCNTQTFPRGCSRLDHFTCSHPNLPPSSLLTVLLFRAPPPQHPTSSQSTPP